MCIVTFLPTHTVVEVDAGTSLLDAARKVSVEIPAPCGGFGVCGKCKVKVSHTTEPVKYDEKKALGEAALAQGYRLACLFMVNEDCTVEVLAKDEKHEDIILSAASVRDVPIQPEIRKVYFTLSEPSMEDARGDAERLSEAVASRGMVHGLMKRLSGFLRAEHWKGTAVLSRDKIIALEKGDTSKSLFGVAFDIGTTTIVGSLIDLITGNVLHTSSCINPQNVYGADVLSRIQHVRDDSSRLTELQNVVVGALNKIIEDLLRSASLQPWAIYEIVVSGNTTMQQLLCGYDVSALGEVPFVPVFEHFHRIIAQDIGIKVHPDASITVFGQIGGFVGGDTLAGMVAIRMDSFKKPVLLVDIGTNGELVLATKDGIFAASTAAGPALEGARISQGMRAMAGAIDEIIIGDDLTYRVLGSIPPMGICGSGILDVVTEMVRVGVLDETGLLNAPEDVPTSLPDAVKARIVENETGAHDFVLVTVEESGLDIPITITQRDIRELQLATGAIHAGITILLNKAGVALDEVGQVFLAGAFGNFIKKESVLGTGLLPVFDPAQITTIGNAALAGAQLVLVSRAEQKYAEHLRQKTQHIDLSMDSNFSMAFADAMIFPQANSTSC